MVESGKSDSKNTVPKDNNSSINSFNDIFGFSKVKSKRKEGDIVMPPFL